MKLTILLLFLTVAGYAQREVIETGISISSSENKQDPKYMAIINCVTLQDYIKAYEADCYTQVLDTVKRCGTVQYEYIPAYENGVLLHYKAVPVDTIWELPKTEMYKYDDGNYSIISSWSINTKQTEEKQVCVDYIYTTLKRKVYPFSDDFWNFVKKL